MEKNELKKKIMNSREVLYFWDARDCNPNGERDPNVRGPRIDPHTSSAIVSDVCFKRTIRDYFMLKQVPGDSILAKQKQVMVADRLVSMKDALINDLNINENELKTLDDQEIYDLVKNTFIDHRLFGSLLSIKKSKIATMGPVQFEPSFSLNRPKLINIRITSTLASGKGKKTGTFGEYLILDYALFSIHGLIKNSLAKISGATELDAYKLFDAIWNGVMNRLTRTKVQQQSRLLISIVFKNPKTQIFNLKESIRLVNSEVKDFTECVLVFNDFLNIIETYKNQIKFIEYREDPFVQYQYREQNFKGFETIDQYVKNCPEIRLIYDFN
ncbi:MAG: CRISPR-associated protein [Promethearchaeota archaeon]